MEPELITGMGVPKRPEFCDSDKKGRHRKVYKKRVSVSVACHAGLAVSSFIESFCIEPPLAGMSHNVIECVGVLNLALYCGV